MQDGKIVLPGFGNIEQVTAEQKARIDKYLSDKKLNEFGDATGTVYMGGTPLFNEQSGATVDRYVYLLRKFPHLR